MKEKFIGHFVVIIFAVALLSISHVIANQYYFDDVDAQILRDREEHLKLKNQNDELQSISDNIDQLEANFSKVEIAYNELKPLLPSETELPTILKSIERSAINRNLKLDLFSQSQPKPINRGLIEIPIQVEISGYPNSISLFVEEMARFPRILHVNSCRMSRLPQDAANPEYQGVRATINLSAFIVPEPKQKLPKIN